MPIPAIIKSIGITKVKTIGINVIIRRNPIIPSTNFIIPILILKILPAIKARIKSVIKNGSINIHLV